MFHLRPSNRKLELWLERGNVIGLDLDDPLVITCVNGSLWVTAPDTGDLIVSSKQTVIVRGPGPLVIEALDSTRVDVASLSTNLAA